MGGSNKQQTTKTSNAPYKSAQPLLDTAMGDALNLYNKDKLVGSTGISTAVPFDSLTREGMRGMRSNARDANSNSAFGSIMGNFNDTYGNGGFNSQQRTAMDALMPTARGDFLNRTDPNFENVLSTTKENAGTDVNSMLAGMGRFAGGAHQGILADKLGNIEADARLGQYNLERDRQSDAANTIFGMGQQGMDNTAAAGDVWSSILGGRDAANQSLMGLGSMREDLAGRRINDRIRRADGPLSQLQALLGIAGGAGGYGTTRAQAPANNNGFSNAAGASLGLASLLFGG